MKSCERADPSSSAEADRRARALGEFSVEEQGQPRGSTCVGDQMGERHHHAVHWSGKLMQIPSHRGL